MPRPGPLVLPIVAAALTTPPCSRHHTAPRLVLWYAIGIVGAFVILRLAGFLLQWLLKLVPVPRDAALRNALKSIYRPGAPAPTVILSLGLGLALLLLIALIDNNLRNQLDRESIPEAPSFVFMDLFDDELMELEAFAAANAQVESFSSNAMLRGAIESINDVPTGDLPEVDPEYAFLFEGEFPLTASGALPERSTVVEGEWWGENYDGPPRSRCSTNQRAARPQARRQGGAAPLRRRDGRHHRQFR